ncbi:glycosyltransferase family 4 protein [Actinospongicola halichondriae]|uniref:glycosyltransferase family 4 protein n=1 Tax=Actinospongicola halichondriae TaxID=3236844 RepID=UPI003D39C3E8
MSTERSGSVLQLLGPSTGGIRRHVAYLTSRLRDNGWSVETAGPDGVLDDLDRVVPIPTRNQPGGTWRARRALQAVAGDHDLIHAHGLKAGLLAASLRNGPPVVLSVHNLVLDEVAGRSATVLRWLEGRLPARVAATIAISDGVADRFAGLGGADRIRVIPPAGPPPDPRRSPGDVRVELGIQPDDDLVVTPARLTAQKDIPLLLDAAEILVRDRPGLRWFVFGDGQLRSELERSVASRGLAEVVHLEPGRRDVDSELAAADVVVITSRWESGPLVLLEAAALGRPMVSTDVGLARTVIDGTAGEVVPVGDAPALAAAVHEVLEAGDRSDVVGAPPRSELSPATLAARVEALYREVSGRAG